MEALLPGYKDNFIRSRFIDWPGDPWVMAVIRSPVPAVTTMGPVLREPYGHCILPANTTA